MKKLLVASLSFLSLITSTTHAIDVGVYYYPGWKRPDVDGWAKIKAHPEREPLLGWYTEGSDEVTRRHLQWMEKYGINFIAYDWYWDQGTGVKNRTYAIDSYIKNAKDYNVDFALLWANHTNTPESLSQFDEIVNYWILNYFKNPKYKKIDGKPVVYLFSSDMLSRDSEKFGSSPKELLTRARKLAKKSGLNGIFFIGTPGSKKDSLTLELPNQTYDAVSAYNYQYGPSKAPEIRTLSKSYSELMDGYSQSWNFTLKTSPLPYVIPVTSGWDRTPWGGSSDPAHDNSYSTPEEFSEHLSRAKAELLGNPKKTLNTIIICCWNEFGEGSYIEPTKKFGFDYLEQIHKILKTQ
ncbi:MULTISPECIES: glycoside hydrolase family 99-like domain-containing protein [Pseudomonas]|jgi:hypothetical protein|uniref:glycoside hydrolase family 99-like domain-containing protein n=1 Tax=Pseudomonas TaxID=286 RepID=UPI001CE1BACE|nr:MULTISPECIES: glycoside hydrolase family 99-like domain-containing protein [Pseudomonas]